MDSSTDVNYEQKYKFLKRKLRLLVFEQECFLSDLRKAQKKLLKVARDKSFLLDRLLQYEQPPSSPPDSDATAESEDEDESSSKKRRLTSDSPLYAGFTARLTPGEPAKKKAKQLKKSKKGSPGRASHMETVSPKMSAPISREEVERRLDARSSIPEIPAASVQMPTDIFGGPDSDGEIEEELVIDMAG